MEDKMTFMAVNAEGKEVECDVLFTFESEETHKNYIVYTDNTNDEQGNIRVYASIYNPDDAESSLEPITSDSEWRVIETILDEIQAQAKETVENESDGESMNA